MNRTLYKPKSIEEQTLFLKESIRINRWFILIKINIMVDIRILIRLHRGLEEIKTIKMTKSKIATNESQLRGGWMIKLITLLIKNLFTLFPLLELKQLDLQTEEQEAVSSSKIPDIHFWTKIAFLINQVQITILIKKKSCMRVINS